MIKPMVGGSSKSKPRTRTFPSQWLLAASVGAIVAAAPGSFGAYGGRARAQALPPGCTSGGNNIAEAGETVECQSPPTPIGPISTTVDDLTIIVGDAGTPTTISAAATDAISMTGSGALTLNLLDPGSTIANTGTVANAISLNLTSGAGDLTIASEGAVIGGRFGILARNQGAGAIDINVVDTTGAGNFGIYAYASPSSSDISVTATGSVTGAAGGIYVNNVGLGDITLNVNEITGGAGISTSATVGETNINLDPTALVTGSAGAGLSATSTGASANISVQGSSGEIIGARDGVNLSTTGADIAVQDLTSITGLAGDGISAQSNGGDITITSVDTILGTGGNGVNAISGGGDISIQGIGLDGGVEGATTRGIYADGRGGAGGNINIGGTTAVGDIKGATHGVYAITEGAGSIAINVAGTVFAENASGVIALDYGSGDTTINVVDVTSQAGAGIISVGRSFTLDNMSIVSTGTVSGAIEGIHASIFGSGDLSVSVNNVTSFIGRGIGAYNSRYGSNLSITSTGLITSGATGISALNGGTGSINISATDIVSQQARGVSVRNYTLGKDININVSGTISARSFGVLANNIGSGATTISVNDVYAERNIAIGVTTRSTSTDLTIEATGTLRGDRLGIDAIHGGTGTLSIDVGDVYGARSTGIFARQSEHGAGVQITSSGNVEGRFGIGATSEGTGDLTVDVANVTGTTGDGIPARHFGAGDISITSSGDVSGGDDGVDAEHYGDGDIILELNGSVYGGDEGVNVSHYGAGAIDITAADVIGAGDDALDVENFSGTSITITTTGTIDGADDGIDAVTYGTDLTINASGPVTGGQSGIEAYNYGTGSTSITVSGAVEGATELGILAVTNNGASISVESGGSIVGAMGAIVTDSGVAPGDPVDDALTLNSGGSISGDVLLLAGADTFNDANGVFTTVFGGDGSDTVNFSGAGRVIDGSGGAGDNLQEFETFNFNSSGFELTGANMGLDAINFLVGAHALSGSVESGITTIANGASLDVSDGAMFTGGLSNAGTLSVNGLDIGAIAVDGDFEQTDTGVLNIDINGASNDVITVSGDVAVDGGLVVTSIANAGVGATSRVIVDGDGALSGDLDATFVNAGLLIAQNLSFDGVNSDVILTTTINSASSISGLNENQSSVGDNLIGLLSLPEIDSDLFDVINTVGGVSSETELGTTLSELHPEGLDVGLRFLDVAQRNFLTTITDQAQPSSSALPPVRTASLSGGPVSVSGADGINVWGAIQGFSVNQGATSQNTGFDGEAFSFAAGVSGIKSGPVTLGFAGGYTDFNGDNDGAIGDRIDAELFHVGANLHAELNERGQGLNSQIDVAVAIASGDADLTQNLLDPRDNAQIQQAGNAEISSFDGRVQWTVKGKDGRNWLLNPHVRAGFSRYDQGALTIGSTGPLSLEVNELDNTRGHVGLGGSLSHTLTDRLSVKARATAVQYFGDTENTLISAFTAASNDAGRFKTFNQNVDQQVELGADLTYDHQSGFKFNAGFFGEVGDLNVYGARASISKSF